MENPQDQQEVQEERIEQEELLEGQETPHPKIKKTHKHHEPKPVLGITQKLHLVSHRTLSTTERLIQSLTKAYEHIFVGDETIENAKFEKEYGLKFYTKNDYKAALKHFEAYASDTDRNDADVLYMMGTCYVTEEDLKKAVDCFKRADEIKPHDFDIVTQLAKCLLGLENYEEALIYFKKASEIKPDEADIFYHCANCYEKLEQVEQAKRMYKKAIDMNPRESVYYHGLGFLYENIGDHKDAIVCFKKAMDLERMRGGR